MLPRLLADLLVALHLAFIVFVGLGGLLAIRWRWVALVHLPSAAWGAYIELTGGICPLTPLENALRRAAGDSGYSGGFIEHYLVPIIYPAGLTREHQIALAVGVVLVNALAYALVWRHAARARKRDTGRGG